MSLPGRRDAADVRRHDRAARHGAAARGEGLRRRQAGHHFGLDGADAGHVPRVGVNLQSLLRHCRHEEKNKPFLSFDLSETDSTSSDQSNMHWFG